MADTFRIALDHTCPLTFLLENLGFLVHPEKSFTNLVQSIKFLGMIINTQTMELRVPGEKIKKIRMETKKVKDSLALTSQKLSHLIRGPWNCLERKWHFICLEIQTAYLGVKTFAKNKIQFLLLITVRQHYSSCIHKQSRRHSVPSNT